MSSYKDKNLKRQLIMEHYMNPLHKNKNIERNNAIYSYSESCADELNLVLTWAKTKLIKAEFNGRGCAVFLSSTDLFLDLILNKVENEILNIIKHYQNMILQQDKYDEKLLDKLTIFENVKTHLNRVACAKLISKVIKNEIETKKKN